MSQMWNILDEHKAWMKEHGYDEEQLSNGQRPGRYMNTLHQLFSDCIQDSLFSSGETDFEVNTTGFFDNHRDLVLLTFFYKVDMDKNGLDIKKLDATLNGLTRHFTVQADWRKEIPPAKDVHQKLKSELYLQRAQIIAPRSAKGKGKSL